MDTALFSEPIQWMLHSLAPTNVPAGTRAYPATLHWRDARVAGNETIRAMFRRCVNNALGGNVSGCRIEDNLAVFAGVRWEDGTRLVEAHIQAIKTEDCDLETYFSDDGLVHEETYYRLDLDRFIGPLFSHPHPHVHSSVHDTPRYALNGWRSENVLVDFLEHVYIQSFHHQWADWAERVWAQHWEELKHPPHLNPFRTILQAAVQNQYPVLRQYHQEIATLKKLLSVRKADACKLRCDPERSQLLAYS
jgi:hypothetical protein